MNVSLRSIFLTSENPAEAARFYAQVVCLPLEKVGDDNQYVYWKIDDGVTQLAIHDASKFADYTHPARADSNVTHLYFKIESHADFLKHLERLGIAPYATDEVVVTVTDPDGRKVMFGIA